MQVAVSGMEDIGDGEPVVAAHLADPLEDMRELFARDRPVHAVIVRTDPADGGEGRLAACPDPQALGFRCAGAAIARV